MLETRACDNYWSCTKRLDNTHVPARLSSNHTMDCEQKHDEFGRTSENLDKLKAHPRSTGRKRARDPSVRPGLAGPTVDMRSLTPSQLCRLRQIRIAPFCCDRRTQ